MTKAQDTDAQSEDEKKIEHLISDLRDSEIPFGLNERCANALESLTEENERLKRRVGEVEEQLEEQKAISIAYSMDKEEAEEERDEARAALVGILDAFKVDGCDFEDEDWADMECVFIWNNHAGSTLKFHHLRDAKATLTQNTEGESDG